MLKTAAVWGRLFLFVREMTGDALLWELPDLFLVSMNFICYNKSVYFETEVPQCQDLTIYRS